MNNKNYSCVTRAQIVVGLWNLLQKIGLQNLSSNIFNTGQIYTAHTIQGFDLLSQGMKTDLQKDWSTKSCKELANGWFSLT
jgi:hypothetical protein